MLTASNKFDPKLGNEVREFSRNLLRKASQATGVVQDEKVRSAEGGGVYGNYSSKFVVSIRRHMVGGSKEK